MIENENKNSRKRGAPIGNQNARKHGFYTLSLSPVERNEFMNLTEKEVSQYHLDASESRYLRMYFRTLFVDDIMGSNCPVQNNPFFNKTIESKSAEENL